MVFQRNDDVVVLLADVGLPGKAQCSQFDNAGIFAVFAEIDIGLFCWCCRLLFAACCFAGAAVCCFADAAACCFAGLNGADTDTTDSVNGAAACCFAGVKGLDTDTADLVDGAAACCFAGAAGAALRRGVRGRTRYRPIR